MTYKYAVWDTLSGVPFKLTLEELPFLGQVIQIHGEVTLLVIDLPTSDTMIGTCSHDYPSLNDALVERSKAAQSIASVSDFQNQYKALNGKRLRQ